MHDVNVADGTYAELYDAYAKIQLVYYNGAETANLFGNNFAQFQDDILFAFDTSRSNETFTNGAVDIRLEIKSNNAIPAKSAAFCLIIYENEFEYSTHHGMVVRKV